MTTPAHRQDKHHASIEFVVLMAVMSSLIAFSIDAMLPALPQIAADLGIARENDRQMIVTALFLGLALSQLVYGPVSDTIGRKPTIYWGFGIFLTGSLMCTFSSNFEIMLLGRFLQGIGAAGPRIVSIALIRDLYSGREMAKILSLVTTIFIVVPVIAPSIGQAILFVAEWRWIFAVLMMQGIIGLVWFAWRQPETLPAERRASFSLRRIALAFKEACSNRFTLGYTITAGLIFGAFIGYLTSTQQILQEQYGLGELFPIYFGANAFAFGAASLVNAKLVMRFGMRRLAATGLVASSLLSIAFFVVTLLTAGHPPLWSLMAYLLAIFFSVGILFGNFNALSMEPMGHIAGVAAAVVGSLTTLISTVLGNILGQAYDGTVRPMIFGFAVLTILSTAVMAYVERGRRSSTVR
jgi:DHA1 family bicyclomycin/chloramphenicol resistance-like MFS transporter